MQYFSTNRKSAHVSFRAAVLDGQPDDKGLYFPENIPQLDSEFVKKLEEIDKVDIAVEVIRPYVGDDIAEDDLRQICSETVNFDFPLVKLSDKISTLELFHGPTFAFKDVGARFMSRCLRYFSRGSSRKIVVVVATSGDTGGAVAAGFHGVEGVEVVILYPKGKVSRVQELQLTTLRGNITAIEVTGSFDDCQTLAKQALADGNLGRDALITSANSINVARWLPQQIYYFFAIKQSVDKRPVFAVPSGNFGNLAAGVLAHISGLPVSKFIAACNANDVVPKFMRSGDYQPQPSVSTLSNAMDVGNPSNFVRILEVFGNSFVDLTESLEAVSVDDAATETTIRDTYEKTGYVLDPHGAVGYRALTDYLAKNTDQTGIFLETAHPVKFDSVKKILGTYGNVPIAAAALDSRAANRIEMDVNYEDLKEIILTKI